MRRGVAVLAAAVSGALALGIAVPSSSAAWLDQEWLTAPVEASACGDAQVVDSAGGGRVLTGTLGATALDPVAALDGIAVENLDPATTSSATSAAAVTDLGSDAWSSAFDLSALSALSIGAGEVLPFGANSGSYTNYGRATDEGMAVGASGAVTAAAGGLVSLETPGASTPRQATLRLSDLLGSTPGGLPVGSVADLGLRVGTLGAIASLDACASLWAASDPTGDLSREYLIEDLGLDLTSGTVSGVVTGLRDSIEALEVSLDALLAPGSSVTGSALTSITTALDAALSLNVLGVGISLADVNDVQVGIDVELQPVLDLVTGPLGDGVVTVDLGSGAVTADLAALVGDASGTSGLNGLAPNTSLLTPAVLGDLSTRVGVLLDDFVTATLHPALDAALDAATVTAIVDATLRTRVTVLFTTIDLIGLRLVTTITGTPAAFTTGVPAPTVSAVATETSTGILTGLLALLGISLSGLVNSVQSAVVAPLVSTVVPVIGSTVVAPAMTAATGLVTGLVTTVTATTLPAAVTELDGVLAVVGSLVRLTANARPDAPGSVGEPGPAPPGRYFQTALHVGVVDGSDASLASLFLANASVGPHALR